MGTNYEHLTAEERATLMVMRADGCSQRAVARCLGRSPSTISRELARNASCCKPVGDTIAVIPTMHHWPANGLWSCARSHDEAQSSLPIRLCSPSC
jgi:Helix-turn-helix domain